jgi:hypothetical protein
MSQRDLIDLITKILTHVPENDILKTKLNKMLENYLYTPPENQKNAWDNVHNLIIERFNKIDVLDLPDWGISIFTIWYNKE